MRYNVAVNALLKRIERNSKVLSTELPLSLYRNLAFSTLLQCQSFSKNWSKEIWCERDAEHLGDQVSKHYQPHSFPTNEQWGNLASQVPTILLCLQLPCKELAVAGQGLKARGRLYSMILYNVPRQGCSLQVYGVYRALLLHLLPSDLSTVTSAHLFCIFAALSVIRAIHVEAHQCGASKQNLYSRDQSPTAKQNQEIAEVVARLPSSLTVHFTIQDDAPLLKRLCNEFLRRLPPIGESFAGDYVKTLIEGQRSSNGAVTSVAESYAFSRVSAASSVHRVSREEFVMLLPKISLHVKKIEKDLNSELYTGRYQSYEKVPRAQRVRYYSNADVATVTNALSSLCLLKNVEEVMAARPLTISEWLFLIVVGMSEETQWAEVTRPALHRALCMAETQRLQRLEENKGLCSVEDTLFPGVPKRQLTWLLRQFISAIFGLRSDHDALYSATRACLPLLREYGRLLHRNSRAAPAQLFESYSILQALWLVTRLIWIVDVQNFNTPKDVTEEDQGDDVAPLSSGAPKISEKINEEVLMSSMAIVHAAQACLQHAGMLTSKQSPLPSPSLQVDASVLAAPQRGAGFQRTALPPSHKQSLLGPRRGMSTRDADLRREELLIGLSQLLFESQFAYCSLVMENRNTSADRLRDAVAIALRALEMSNNSFGAFLEKLSHAVQDHTSQNSLPNEHTARYRYADKAKTLPLHVLRNMDAFSHQKTNAVRVINNLLLLSGEQALSPQERATVIALFTDVVNSITSTFLVLKDAQYVHYRSERIVQSVSKCYLSHVMPSVAIDDAPHYLLENRRAVQRLSCACMETINHIWSSSSAAFSDSCLRNVSAARSGVPCQAVELDSVLLALKVIPLSGCCGLTSEEIPHLVSTLRHTFDILGAYSKRQQPGRCNRTLPTFRSKNALHLYCTALYRLCSLGIYDEGCLTAAAESLRRCGVEENIKMMSKYERYQFFFDALYCLRILSQRFSTSRESRQLVRQILVIAARMTAERLALEEVAISGGNCNKRVAATSTLSGLAVLMWQLANTATLITVPSPAVDKSINALLQYVKRHLLIPAYAGYTPPPASSISAKHLDYCEEALRSTESKSLSLLYTSPPRTPREVTQLSNMIMRAVVVSAKVMCRRMAVDFASGPTTAHRQRWQTYMEIFAIVVQRFEGLIAPTLWHRISRECLFMHNTAVAVGWPTTLLRETLVLSIDRLLLYSKAHNNIGTWWSEYPGDTDGDSGEDDRGDPLLYEAANTQLIAYHRAARLLPFHEYIKNMDRRVYFVELMERLVQEVAEIERRGEVPFFAMKSSPATADRQQEVMTTTVQSGRTHLLSAFRRMRM
ncbi:hypothetical protein ABL78_0350 [Leptomonas seymouri]|uniref:Uncharacterized protein n=1 Tax=Leptomonas seymouri TaxID=5684 RepID=A0A0N1I3W7_LEPSE|nr:hypothetical protein ABL78_0350 [Leptomonas seymouri]|eukprot:KPI90590.1 hypothetical protein ABL78_0350 [Leptomonas seymouri]